MSANSNFLLSERQSGPPRRAKRKYVQQFRTRHGRIVRYFRRTGHPAVRLHGEPGSPEFERAYQEAFAGRTSPKPARIATAAKSPGEAVYFVQIGRAIKIGYTAAGIEGRLASFRTATAARVRVLGVFPGNRRLEGELHRLFGEVHITNEFFRPDSVVREFITIAKRDTIDAALTWLRNLVRGGTRKMTATERRAVEQSHYDQVLAERFAKRRSTARCEARTH